MKTFLLPLFLIFCCSIDLVKTAENNVGNINTTLDWSVLLQAHSNHEKAKNDFTQAISELKKIIYEAKHSPKTVLLCTLDRANSKAKQAYSAFILAKSNFNQADFYTKADAIITVKINALERAKLQRRQTERTFEQKRIQDGIEDEVSKLASIKESIRELIKQIPEQGVPKELAMTPEQLEDLFQKIYQDPNGKFEANFQELKKQINNLTEEQKDIQAEWKLEQAQLELEQAQLELEQAQLELEQLEFEEAERIEKINTDNNDTNSGFKWYFKALKNLKDAQTPLELEQYKKEILLFIKKEVIQLLEMHYFEKNEEMIAQSKELIAQIEKINTDTDNSNHETCLQTIIIYEKVLRLLEKELFSKRNLWEIVRTAVFDHKFKAMVPLAVAGAVIIGAAKVLVPAIEAAL
jgi:hypothetical protein